MRNRIFLLRLALRNMMRRKNRTFLTAALISAAVLVYLFLDSHLASMDEISYENIINFSSAHIQITTESYWEEKDDFPLEHLLIPGEKLLSAAAGAEGFKALSPRLDFAARINDGFDELPVIARGVDPVREKEVFLTGGYFVEGGFFEEEGIVMGAELASLMNLGAGDYVTLIFRTRHEYFNTIDAEITGLLHTPNPGVNENIVYVPLETARRALETEDMLSHIMVRLSERNLAARAASSIAEEAGAGIKVTPWHELEAVAVNQAKNAGNNLILFIILLIAGLGIINSVILSALERVHETGMMKAMGVEEKDIVKLFMTESAAIAVIGALSGCLLGALSILFLRRYGIDYTSFFGELSQYGIPMIGPVYGAWEPKSFILVFLFSVSVAVISSVFPARWAAKKEPVEALQGKGA